MTLRQNRNSSARYVSFSSGPKLCSCRATDEVLMLVQTSIIATIGPKTNNVEVLQQLMEAGMNIGELGTPTYSVIANLKGYSPHELLAWILRVSPIGD